MKPFKISLKDGRIATPAEIQWIADVEEIMSEDGFVGPTLSNMYLADMHLSLMGHAPTLDSEVCFLCGKVWRK